MAEDPCRDFFLQPTCPAQRQYEALRCVFVEGCSQKEIAERFGYSYDSFRQLVHQFRSACLADNPPPFSPPIVGADRQRPPTQTPAP
jgi:hypothetical protein